MLERVPNLSATSKIKCTSSVVCTIETFLSYEEEVWIVGTAVQICLAHQGTTGHASAFFFFSFLFYHKDLNSWSPNFTVCVYTDT